MIITRYPAELGEIPSYMYEMDEKDYLESKTETITKQTPTTMSEQEALTTIFKVIKYLRELNKDTEFRVLFLKEGRIHLATGSEEITYKELYGMFSLDVEWGIELLEDEICFYFPYDIYNAGQIPTP